MGFDGIWRRPITDFFVGIDEDKDHLPKDYKLFQNYPNPFNPETVISYQLSVNSWVTLKVYDMIGREVETLVNEYKLPGKYSAFFTLRSALSSGIYFYQIQAGKYSQVKKMILIK